MAARIILLLLIFAVVPVIGLAQTSNSYSQEMTPTPFVRRSIFSNDTCAPPCWFGLVPDESTPADVEEFFRLHPEMYSADRPPRPRGTFDSDTGVLLDGLYLFFTYEYDPYTADVYRPNRIYIRDGRVDLISLTVYHDYEITLGQTLDALGMPNQVHFDNGTSNSEPVSIDLIYLDSRLRIRLWNRGSCLVNSLLPNFRVESVRYYSEDAANEVQPVIGSYEQQPALTAVEYAQTNLSLEVWESWLAGEVDENCWLAGPGITLNLPNRVPLSSIELPETHHSLFPQDSCTPPCWFGLTPGISRVADIEEMLNSSDTIFDWRLHNYGNEEITYFLQWIDFTRLDSGEGGTDIDTLDGVVGSILVQMNHLMLLQQVIEILGLPDAVRIYEYDGSTPTFLYLEYYDMDLTVLTISDLTACNLPDIGVWFWVDRLIYWEPNAERGGSAQLVSDEVWNTWLEGEPVSDCPWRTEYR